ncbi:MAG: hypothetical protein H7A35_09655 [Planctomycetales bacterium]|nr:hypothetical protein [bacterium]UNM07143.1 MAG: hypothetical protein H7A35_09655 [Planctomycetales bacterium]
MRILIAAFVLMFAMSTSAFAQAGYIYQSSGLEWVGTAPVQAGDTMKALITLYNGQTAIGDMYVNGWYQDDLFGYWEGYYNRDPYYYDVYSGYWKPGPVNYRYANLTFQGEVLEGWARQFGQVIDYNIFLGRDGVLYKRMQIKRNRHRNSNRRREVVYSYFLNTETGERSDGGALPYRVITGNADDVVALINQQITDNNTVLSNYIKDNPLFPQWQTEAFVAPQEVVVASSIPRSGELSLFELIEGEIGPIEVGEAASGEEAAVVQSTSAADGTLTVR